MALIDVSELFSDPDFVDPIEVIRNSVSVSLDGIAQATPDRFGEIVASMQPASQKELMLLPETQRVEGVMECWTNFALREAVQDGEADIVIWKGQQYRVIKLNDWQHFGGGWTRAVVSLIDLVQAEDCCDGQY